eukprot:scaffold110496_cov19-Tisochrysis_lutea.AAC.1
MEWKQHVIRCLYNQDASVQTAWQPFAHLILNMQHEIMCHGSAMNVPNHVPWKCIGCSRSAKIPGCEPLGISTTTVPAISPMHSQFHCTIAHYFPCYLYLTCN